MTLTSKFLVFLFGGIAFGIQPCMAASGMFSKMPAATNVFLIDGHKDSKNARMTAWALQGLVNQSSAEVYIANQGQHLEQLKDSGKPFEKLQELSGTNAGLRTLFQKYQGRVKKMFVYDPDKDWTWYLALMSAAQQNGIPVTESIKNDLTSEFGWKGDVEDFQNKWTDRNEAYDWALLNLMPGCSKQVVFALNPSRQLPLIDYAVASKGFVFWLDLKTDQAEMEKIFQTKGYGVGTSLMGYANGGDKANEIANRFGLGYVVSDLYGNGSFWSSFPDKTYIQTSGKAVKAEPGKIYVSIMWSDGDNIQFDQNSLYLFWKSKARGTVPVATTLSPSLQELNSPLLDWYYSKMTANDELIAGPCGVQFIYGNDFNSDLFPAWCNLNKEWLADAGFRTSCLWHTPYLSSKYIDYVKTCGLTGILLASNHKIFVGAGVQYDGGMPVIDSSFNVSSEANLFEDLSKMTPNSKYPVFKSFNCIVEGFNIKDGGYSAIQRQVDRLNTTYPDRFVFLLPKDLFATVRSYCHLPASP